MSSVIETISDSAPATFQKFRSGWIDRFAGSDPGWNRFRNALQSVITIGIILEAELLFVHFTHALQIAVSKTPLSASAVATVATANHEYLVIAMLLGAIIGMISTFSVMDQTARGQLVTMLFLPMPMVPTLVLALALGNFRTLSLVVLVLILAIGTYCRRFGPRGFASGLLMFMGFFLGFFLHAAIRVDDIGWLAAELGVGLVVSLVVRFLFFYPRPAKALVRTQRSYNARAQKVAALALSLFSDPAHVEREVRRLHHQLARLNEAALMIDAQLGDPNAVAEGSSGQLLHQRLFDAELALTNIARFAQAMAHQGLPERQRSEVSGALAAIARGDAATARNHVLILIGLLNDAEVLHHDVNAVVAHRFAGSVLALADAMTEWITLGRTDAEKGEFQPSVSLFGGWLPGSTQVSAATSLESGVGWSERVRLAPYTRTAIQIGVAAGGAIALGVILSSYRFYWALIAAFITFMGANNTEEQIRKAFFRVIGTVVGIGIGSLLVKAAGHHTYWSIAVILIALFFGFYLMRINYAFMVIGITVMVSQLYVQLGEFSNSLLLLRLEETALGAAVAMVVVTCVLPLRTRRVLRVALRAYVEAVSGIIEHSSGKLLGGVANVETSLRSDARDVDASYQALVATAQPLRRSRFGATNDKVDQTMRLASAARYYSRNLVVDVDSAPEFDATTRWDIERALRTFHGSLTVIADALTGSRNVTYTRSASLFDSVERHLERESANRGADSFAIRDFNLLDGTMAQMAQLLGLKVTDFDTTRM